MIDTKQTLDDLSIGQCRYEFGVFAQCTLQKVFRTDVEDAATLAELEARKYIEMQRQNNPTIDYELKMLQWVDC